MKKSSLNLTLVFALFIGVFSGLNINAQTKATKTSIVSKSDLGSQDWLINEVNRQLSPLKVDQDLSMSDLNNVTSIQLNNKNLEGQIPKEIKNLKNLKIFSVYSNKLTGELPKEIGELEELENLRVDYNKLSGKIPEGLGSIKSIMMQNNRFVGLLPKSLYESRTGNNEVNVSGNQVTLDSTKEISSVYSAYTFIGNDTFRMKLNINKHSLDAKKTDKLKPFDKDSEFGLDFFISNAFDRNLFSGHNFKIINMQNNDILYNGIEDKDITIPLSAYKGNTSLLLKVVMNDATNNDYNQVMFAVNIEATPGADVTVNHFDEDGKKIADSVILSGDYEEKYNSEPIEVEGYTLIPSKLPSNQTGLFLMEEQTVNYYYKVNGEEDGENPSEEKTPSNEKNNDKSSSKKDDKIDKKSDSKKSNKNIPITGNNLLVISLAIFGIVISAGTGYIYLKYRY